MKTTRLRSHSMLLLIAAACMISLTGCVENTKVADAKPKAFWPQYPDEPRIQFLTSFEKSSDVAPPKSGMDELIYGKEPQKDLPIAKPYGVEMYNGKIYVCDLRSDCVTILDLRNKLTLVMGATGADRLENPCDIAISPDGYKYVADLGRGAIAIFDPADRYLRSFAVKDMKPTGLAIHGDELYVCDFSTQSVLVLDRRDGRQLRTIGGPGPKPGQFIRPLGVDVDRDGNVYVTDVIKCQLFKFDPQGKLLTSFGAISNVVGGMVRPKHIAVDPDGIIYVVDASFQNVQLFNQVGQVYTFFGGPGGYPGAMYLPAGICVHDADLDLFQQYVHPAFEAQRLIIVTNQFGPAKVSVYAYGRLKPGKTVADIAASKGLIPAQDASRQQPGRGTPAPLSGDAVAPGSEPAAAPAANPVNIVTPAPSDLPAEPAKK